MERIPAPGDLYRHCGGKIYQIVTVAVHAETGEQMAVYQEMSGNFGVYTMPLVRFESGISQKTHPEASQLHLFEKIGKEDIPCQKPEIKSVDRIPKNTEARPHVQRPADSRRVLSQESAENSEGGAYYEKRRRQIEEREQRRGMFRKPERHETATEELRANPCLLKFLEADTYEERFHVLNQIQDQITDRLIDDIAVVLDVVIPEGALNDRYRQLRDVILTRQKYETNRIR